MVDTLLNDKLIMTAKGVDKETVGWMLAMKLLPLSSSC